MMDSGGDPCTEYLIQVRRLFIAARFAGRRLEPGRLRIRRHRKMLTALRGVRYPLMAPRKEGEPMRMLLRVSIPVETGNAAAKAGTLGSTVEKILGELKPEASYFFADDNVNRSASIVFDMKDSSQIPAIAEPWFLAFNAKVSLRPVMSV